MFPHQGHRLRPQHFHEAFSLSDLVSRGTIEYGLECYLLKPMMLGIVNVASKVTLLSMLVPSVARSNPA